MEHEVEFYPKGYILDVSLFRQPRLGELLSELVVFARERRERLTAPSKLFAGLSGDLESFAELVTDEMDLRGIARREAISWILSPNFEQLRAQILPVLIDPREFTNDVEGDLTEQTMTLSSITHFGVVASGKKWFRRIRDKGVLFSIQVRGVKERFVTHLRERGRGHLKRVLKIIISKIVDLPGVIIPGWNLVGEGVDYLLEKAAIFVDGS